MSDVDTSRDAVEAAATACAICERPPPNAATLRALLAERDAALAEAARLRDAVTAFVAWLDHENGSPDYGVLTRDTHPEGEAIWREWWDRGLRLCRIAQDLGRAALAGSAAP